MSYEELQQLPPDTIIKVRMNYQYSVDEVTPQIWEFFLSHGAEIENEYAFNNSNKTTQDAKPKI